MSTSDTQRMRRLKRTMTPTAQNTLMYTSLYQNGLMHITGDRYSMTYQLGDASYATAQQEDRLAIIDAYAEAINSLDAATSYQLLVINRKIEGDALGNMLYALQGDEADIYREEYNQIMKSRFSGLTNNFEVEKYITISQPSVDKEQALVQLQDTGSSLISQFGAVDINLKELTGVERLRIFSELLKDEPVFPYSYEDIVRTGLTTKSFIAPGRIEFQANRMLLNERLAKVLYVRQYPSFMTDKLIRNLTTLGIELAITVQANPYDTNEALTQINHAAADIQKEKRNKHLKAASQGIDGSLYTSSYTEDVGAATELWREEIVEHDQKIYSGLIAIYFKADTDEEFKQAEEKIRSAARKLHLELETAYYYQEEALNTMLPIGLAFLDVRQRFMRDMTTDNIATQIPFANQDLRSSSSRALYYGQNQLSNNIITLDRKQDLYTGSGVILGSSGSGKSMAVKIGEVIPTKLKYPEDRIIIVDPEDEYSDIGQEFGAQMIDIFPGSKTHINLLDKPDLSKLDEEDRNFIAHKSNLLMGLFQAVMGSVTSEQFGIIDRVTKLVYDKYETPTLKEWHEILLEQPEEEAQNLALKVEQYTIGSNDIFSKPTNVDLTNNFVIFNLKNLAGPLKPFALMVLQDYIWNQVVEHKGKLTIRLYWDEIQLQFKTLEQAIFFTELWSRIRKYGAIATGITQNPETMTSMEEGRKLLSNSEFFILLKLKKQDIAALRQTISLTDEQVRYIERPKGKGTGLIVAGNVVVPFENPIPKNTKLYQLVATDA